MYLPWLPFHLLQPCFACHLSIWISHLRVCFVNYLCWFCICLLIGFNSTYSIVASITMEIQNNVAQWNLCAIIFLPLVFSFFVQPIELWFLLMVLILVTPHCSFHLSYKMFLHFSSWRKKCTKNFWRRQLVEHPSCCEGSLSFTFRLQKNNRRLDSGFERWFSDIRSSH